MIAQLQKIQIITTREHCDSVLDFLHSTGGLHIIKARNTEQEETKIDELKFLQANASFSLNFLKTHLGQKKKKFLSFLTQTAKTISYKQLRAKAQKTNIAAIANMITDIDKKLIKNRARLQKITSSISELAPWNALNELPSETKYTKSIAGTISLAEYLPCSQALEKATQKIEIEKLSDETKKTRLVITFVKTDENEITKILDEHRFEKHLFNNDAIPSNELAALEQKKKLVAENIKKLKHSIKNLKTSREPLGMAVEYLGWEIEKLEAKRNSKTTRYIISITAWVKQESVKLLRNALREISPVILVSRLKTKQNERPPVIIENNSFIQPFEAVTRIYGLPKYNEVDPTPYLAPFFIIFYALCITDAGYGLIMAIAGFSAIKLFKIPRENQRIFRLIVYSGIVTIIIGALFGGWFGVDVEKMRPSALKGFIEFFKIIDPIQDTIKFMIIAFALGFLQIWFSQIVKIIAAIKNHDIGAAMSGAAWAIFLLTGTGTIIGALFHISLLTIIARYSMLFCIIALAVIEGRKVKMLLLKPVVGILQMINGLISITANTLSYSRLMALGLSTGIIAFIFNALAGIFRDLTPYFGWLAWLIIIIGGHSFNIAINALGGFIHSARLQFVEFFPNFMEGGGERFVPFKRISKKFRITGEN